MCPNNCHNDEYGGVFGNSSFGYMHSLGGTNIKSVDSDVTLSNKTPLLLESLRNNCSGYCFSNEESYVYQDSISFSYL